MKDWNICESHTLHNSTVYILFCRCWWLVRKPWAALDLADCVVCMYCFDRMILLVCYCVSVTLWNSYNSSAALPLTLCVQWTVTDQPILGHKIKFNQWLLLLYVPLFDFCMVHSWKWGSLRCCPYCLPCEEQPQHVWVTGMATLTFQQRTQRWVVEYTVGWHQLVWLATPLTQQF